MTASPRPARIAAALSKAYRKYEIAFSAHDRLARHAATTAGLGYLAMPRRVVPPALAIETPGTLPALRAVVTGIITRDGIEPEELAPLVKALEAALH